MTALRNVLLAVVILGLIGVAQAQVQGKQKAKGEKKPSVSGVVVKVEGEKLVVKVAPKGGDAKEVTVTTDNKTKVTLDGKKAALGDLKEGMKVKVTPDTGTAQKIDAKTPGKAREGKGGKAK